MGFQSSSAFHTKLTKNGIVRRLILPVGCWMFDQDTAIILKTSKVDLFKSAIESITVIIFSTANAVAVPLKKYLSLVNDFNANYLTSMMNSFFLTSTKKIFTLMQCHVVFTHKGTLC